ncbi:MAG: GHKL domain-containing protein [Bacteroidales bacterium]|nr:GHKL domain-containing protein [Bacteroidales bacterium]
MVYKKYYINIIVRILLILINCLLFSFALLKSSYLYTITFLGILIIIQSITLLRYINLSNVFLTRFLNYIKESNTTIEFSETLKDTPFKDLAYYFTEINSIIQNAKIEKENQYQFLQYIFNHVNIGLIAFDKEFKVLLVNESTKKLFNLKSLNNINVLNNFNPKFYKTISNLSPGEQKILPTRMHGKNLQLAIKLSNFKLLDQEIFLISLQDIKPELDQKEIESWQKLNRVLTHEIMNSVSPIIGLTNNVSKLWKDKKQIKTDNKINYDIIKQTVQSVNIVEERSQGLNDFVKKFRSVTANFNPEFKNILASELFEDLTLFMHETFEENNIKFTYQVIPENLQLLIDKNLIEQVIINLLKNSTEALIDMKNKLIQVKAFINDNNQKLIEIIDNGTGIEEDKIDLIFTPFYTTKSTGSGIGLSLSRNILKQHGYNIDVKSNPNIETVFTLYL